MNLCTTFLAAALSSCAGDGQTAGPLGRNVLACLDQQTVTRLHKAGQAFQRAADDAVASGRCRMFDARHVVRDFDRSQHRFVDPASGKTFWAYAQGG